MSIHTAPRHSAATRGPLARWRAEHAERRAARVRAQQVRAELAAYDNPADIYDLLAAVDQDATEADEVRDALADNLVAYHDHAQRAA